MKKNLIGQKFGRLLVVDFANSIKNRTAWLCQCECNNFKIIKTENLKDGSTKSCGCLNIEKRSARAQAMYSVNIKYSPREASARRVWSKRYNDGISFEDFYKLSQMNCFYCGAEPNNLSNSAQLDSKSSQYAKDNGDFIYNGLDRIDSSKSHIIENCVPCCKWCNISKRERNIDEFKLWVEKIYKHLFQK